MSEANLWKRMRKGIQPYAFAQRLENLVGDGVPDVVLHSRNHGGTCFVELKYRPEVPKRHSTPIFTGGYGLRPAQVAWIQCRADAGANIWILGQCSNSLFLINGRYARDLAAMTNDDIYHKSTWCGIAKSSDWETMIKIMLDF
jgi:hypothetical protein